MCNEPDNSASPSFDGGKPKALATKPLPAPMDEEWLKEQVALLHSSSTADRMRAADVLSDRASQYCDALIKLLQDADWRIRWGAAHALGKSAQRSAASALRKLLTDSQPRVARTAAWALGRIRSTESIKALSESVGSTDSHLSATSVWALGHIGGPDALEALISSLEIVPPRSLRSLAIALSEIGSDAAQPLVEMLQNGSTDGRTRSARILSRFGLDSAHLLLPLFESAQVKQRRAAAHILGTLRIPKDRDEHAKDILKTVEIALRRHLTDEDSRVRRNTIRSIGLLGFDDALDDLTKMLGADPDQTRIVLNALAAIGNVEAGPAIQDLLDTKPPEQVELAASRALAKLGLQGPTVRRTAPDPSLPSRDTLPHKADYLAFVTPGLETVAWEEISNKLVGASLKSFGDGKLTFEWKGNPQATSVLRSVRKVFQGGAFPQEIPLARRLRRYRVCNLPASLDSNTAFCLSRLASLGKDDVFVDLTSGSATIAIERALDGPALHILAGDIDVEALTAARQNIAAGSQNVHLLHWDAAHTPLPDNFATSIASNLPYGHRSGSHNDNALFYPCLINEIKRILKPTGVAVLLTAERTLMRQSLEQCTGVQLISEQEIQAGGLRPIVFIIQKEEPKSLHSKRSVNQL